MRTEEIKLLHGQEVNMETLDEVECSECVTDIECLGQGSVHTECDWYAVQLEDGTDIDLYCKAYVD